MAWKALFCVKTKMKYGNQPHNELKKQNIPIAVLESTEEKDD